MGGVLVAEGIVLTAAHVLTDMELDNEVRIGSECYEVASAAAHGQVDVGVVRLVRSPPVIPDLALEHAELPAPN